MISIKSFFKHINWRAVRNIFVLQLLALLFLGSFFRYFVLSTIDVSAEMNIGFLHDLDVFLVTSFWGLSFLAFFFSVFYIWYFHAPLNAMISKVRAIRRGQFSKKKGMVIRESRGQWYQLDLLLNKVAKDLKRFRVDLARGKGELEAVLTAAHDAILAVDKEMCIRYYNAPMTALFESREEGHWGKHIKEVIRNQAILSAFRKATQEQVPQFIQVHQEMAMDSSMHCFQVSVSPFLDEKNHKTRGAVAIFHDITELKKVEKVRVDFVANASHELKTPLTSVEGYLGFIKDSCRDKPETGEAFETVEANLQRLNRLVSDLLDLSKLDSEELPAKEFIDVEPLVSNVLSELRSAFESSEIRVECEFFCKQVLAVPELLEHVVLNLVENAIKYSPKGALIRLTCEDNEAFTRLSVKDNGPGIESYHQHRIFERFYRVRDSEAVSKSGTGLGLSIVKNSMLRMGGRVDIKSAPGLGSEFVCDFPKS